MACSNNIQNCADYWNRFGTFWKYKWYGRNVAKPTKATTCANCHHSAHCLSMWNHPYSFDHNWHLLDTRTSRIRYQ